MAAAVETMAYSGEVPWHREGVAVQPDLTPYEMMEAAELDWTVTKRNTWTSAIPMNQYKPDEDGNIALQLLPNPDRFDLVRDSDNSILGSCGSDYQPIQNERIFDFFQKFSKHADITMETAGSLKNGQSIWGLARINDAYELTGGDEMNSFVLFHQPHQPGHSMNIRGTEVRVVCNTHCKWQCVAKHKTSFVCHTVLYLTKYERPKLLKRWALYKICVPSLKML